jgi:hypothetical protein
MMKGAPLPYCPPYPNAEANPALAAIPIRQFVSDLKEKKRTHLSFLFSHSFSPFFPLSRFPFFLLLCRASSLIYVQSPVVSKHQARTSGAP